jgi:trimethylamine--corrinoid protein Co-methyltransferase
MAQELAHYYNLPLFGLAGASEAKLVDTQAGAEAALTLLVDTLAGANLIHDLDYLESGLTFSLAQLVICDEIVSWLKRFMTGVEINDQTLALDLIDQVGPDGQYLDTEHTRAHFRERWYPRVFERDSYSNWRAKGGKSLAERAAERVEDILVKHQPEPLPDDVAQTIKAIVRRAEERTPTPPLPRF